MRYCAKKTTSDGLQAFFIATSALKVGILKPSFLQKVYSISFSSPFIEKTTFRQSVVDVVVLLVVRLLARLTEYKATAFFVTALLLSSFVVLATGMVLSLFTANAFTDLIIFFRLTGLGGVVGLDCKGLF